jgi:hypothetical protein
MRKELKKYLAVKLLFLALKVVPNGKFKFKYIEFLQKNIDIL